MRNLMMIGLVLAMTAAACGGASETSNGDETSDEAELAIGQTSSETPSTPQSDSGDTDGVEPGTTTTTPPVALETPPPVTAAEPQGETPVGSSTPPGFDHANPLVTAAIGDLVGRIGVEPVAVTVVSVEQVTWSDGSLGCPQRGMSYTQALVDGSRVILEVAGRQFDYHSGHSGDPFLCELPLVPDPPSKTDPGLEK